MGLLTGRVVVVTGAARGLGAAYARGISAADGQVVAADLHREPLDSVVTSIVASGGVARARVTDVADWADAQALVDETVAAHGRIDALVNNAGLFAMARAGEESPEQVRAMLEVNVLGAIACGSAAIAAMRRQGRGVIVNVTSGEQMGRPETAVYGATKAATATLTYAWASELAEIGVRVNAISPNAQTHMAEVLAQFRGAPSGQNEGIEPEANVPLLLYLLSDLSAEVTGQVLRSFGPELMITTHPAVAEPVLRDTEWTPESIAAAVRDHLPMQRLGVQRVHNRYMD